MKANGHMNAVIPAFVDNEPYTGCWRSNLHFKSIFVLWIYTIYSRPQILFPKLFPQKGYTKNWKLVKKSRLQLVRLNYQLKTKHQLKTLQIQDILDFG